MEVTPIYNFDDVKNRRGTNSAKWDEVDEKYSRNDLIHLGVADMDFSVSEAIQSALTKVNENEVFGYTVLTGDYFNTIMNWYKSQYGIAIKKEWILFSPRIITSFGAVLDTFIAEKENVITHSPMYSPLINAVQIRDIELRKYPLRNIDGKYSFKISAVKELIDNYSRIMLVCNPHNPTTRCWTKKELKELLDVCKKNEMIIFSDEVHGDIVKQDSKFTSILSLVEEGNENIVVASSPSKSFNIPGLMLSHLIIPSQKTREIVQKELQKIGVFNPNSFVPQVIDAAYNDSKLWLEKLRQYIDANELLVRSYFKENFPDLTISDREGTFLLWIDYTNLEITEEEIHRWLVDKAKVTMSLGSDFGPEGNGYLRMNIGTSQKTLQMALERMKNAWEFLE